MRPFKLLFKRRVKMSFLRLFSSKSKAAFLSNFRGKNVSLFDVGCGTNSPAFIKAILPDCHYSGLDVSVHQQDSDSIDFADSFELCSPAEFGSVIERRDSCFDVVVSSHNIEHCNERSRVLLAMLKSLKSGGNLFLSFPSEASVFFPKRDGCLNYYDDVTHTDQPPEFDAICKLILSQGFDISYSSRRYRPLVPACIGIFLEPVSFFKKRTLPGTWALYGFESIIHATKR